MISESVVETKQQLWILEGKVSTIYPPLKDTSKAREKALKSN